MRAVGGDYARFLARVASAKPLKDRPINGLILDELLNESDDEDADAPQVLH